MSSVATAIGASAVVGAGASYLSSKEQAKGARKAADARVEAAKISADARKEAQEKNIDFQREIFEQQREDARPWREVGEQALGELQQGVTEGRFTPGEFNFDFKESPGYQYRRDEALDAVESSSAARGTLQSGANQQALMREASGMASQEYGNEFQRAVQSYGLEQGRLSDQYNQRASLAQVGQTANQGIRGSRSAMAQRVGRSTQATGQAIAQGAQQTGNALAQGARGAANARASSYQGLARSANQGIQNYMLYSQLGS